MSSRRAARGHLPAATSRSVPHEFRDQLAPIWRDIDALRAHPVLSQYVDEGTASRLAMGGRVYHHIPGAWAEANGYGRDWHALRADGIIT
ncbi:hypothetical protein [Janibacter sp. G1551]|uniref:hypothetical protein n=1 Tax=Janibacter sp. G1551 TaxID=3420440 RepID=UPI003D04009D